MPATARSASPFFPRWLPFAVVGLSLVLRVALALQGGQYFFGDEGRYDRGIQLYQALAAGRLTGIREIVALPEHALFPWVGALVTAAQHVLAALTGRGDWAHHPEYIASTIGFGAAALSLFSTLNLWLLHRLALATGAADEEAGWALVLMAAANTAFYYSRHLLPYECAISAMLFTLWVGLGRATLVCSFICGLFAGLTYHLYNGYWYVVPVTGLLYALAHRAHPHRANLVTGCAVGMLAALALPVAVGRVVGGDRYFELMTAFSRSVSQGVFAEGWSLPWEYFWHSEGSFGAAVFAAFLLAVVQAHRAGTPLPPRVRGALVSLTAVYFLLVLFSVGLARFVVYARTVKPLVPLFCLLGGWALARSLAARPQLRPLALSGIVLAGAIHFSPHFTQVFPRETEIAVLRAWGNPKHTLSVAGSVYIPLAMPVTRPDLALVNAQMLYPARGYIGYPAGDTLLHVAHPLAYTPFQYESHTPSERALLRAHDISIRLIKLAAPDTLPANMPTDLRYQNQDRPSGH